MGVDYGGHFLGRPPIPRRMARQSALVTLDRARDLTFQGIGYCLRSGSETRFLIPAVLRGRGQPFVRAFELVQAFEQRL
jgi:hypothetical protein